MSGMAYKQMDIVLLPFPYSDLSVSKKRPALVISNDEFNASTPDLICCLITTNLKQDKYSVGIDEQDVENGKLFFKSKVKPYRVFTTDSKIILKKLCSLKQQKFAQVIKNLHKITSIN